MQQIPLLLQTATLQHEATNPRDKNALILESVPPGSTLGYLPRSVSQHLAALVKAGLLGSLARVMEVGSTNTAAVNIVLEVTQTCSSSLQSSDKQ